MTRPLSFALAGIALAAMIGGGLLYARRDASAPSAVTPAAAAPERAAGALAPRAGRVLALDAAIKDLNLIRPSRRKPAAAFALPLAGGGTFRLADQRGRPVLINFWATWCAPCREEMPALERLWRQQQGNGMSMIAISLDVDAKAVAPFVKEHRLTFPVALDSGFEVANAYGVRALPASFVVDRQGELAALALGPRTWDNDAAHSLFEALTR